MRQDKKLFYKIADLEIGDELNEELQSERMSAYFDSVLATSGMVEAASIISDPSNGFSKVRLRMRAKSDGAVLDVEARTHTTVLSKIQSTVLVIAALATIWVCVKQASLQTKSDFKLSVGGEVVD